MTTTRSEPLAQQVGGASVHPAFSAKVRDAPPIFIPPTDHTTRFNFDQGNPGTETYPVVDLLRLMARVIDDSDRACLHYFHPEVGHEEMVFGHTELRDELAKRIGARDGRTLSSRNIFISSGSTGGLALLFDAFVDPGDAVIVEQLTFPFAARFIQARGASLCRIPEDEDGMQTGLLEKELVRLRAEGITPKVIYTIPTFHLPTGTTMSLDRRRELVRIAAEHDLVIIEDNVYAELRFDGAPVPTIFSVDDRGVVIHSDSFSKTVAPGIRLGWMAASEPLISGIARIREDLGPSLFMEHVMTAYLREGLLDPQIERIRTVYKRKRDIAVAALHEYCGDLASFRYPEGSFFVWVEVSDRVDAHELQRLLHEAAIVYRSGARFTEDDSGTRYLRLSYSNMSEDDIRLGIAEIGRCLRLAMV